jgi:hypothetical protein
MMTNQRTGTTNINAQVTARLSPVENVRLSRLVREIRLTDQILSDDVDTVSVDYSGPAPAWTNLDGNEITFAHRSMPAPKSKLDVAVWLGTNAHELGHVLFSPRRDSLLMRRMMAGATLHTGIAKMHNIAEDQRQERLILARFSPWRGYLTAALGHHLVVDSDHAWLLLAGRTWVPADVRAQSRARFAARRGEQAAAEVATLIGAYQRLTDPGESQADAAWQILMDLLDLFQADKPQTGTDCTVMTDGDPDTSDPGDGAPTTADDADNQDDGSGEPQDGSDGEDDGDGADDGQSGSEGPTDGSDGRSDPNGDGTGQSEPGDSDNPSDTGNGAGTSDSQPAPIDMDDVRKALTDAAAATIENDRDVSDDLGSVLDTLDHGRPGEQATGADPVGRYMDTTDATRRLHREIARSLVDLKDESEPAWIRRVDSGRLSVRRLATSKADADTLFDRYQPGMMDATQLEIVLLLDVSSSMAGQNLPLGQATWSIRRAVDDLEGRCTVLTFNDSRHQVVARPGQRPDGRTWVPATSGGTDPTSALTEALKVLSGSDAKHRLMIVLTDGDWVYNGDKAIPAMNAAGIVTVCALLGLQLNDERRHYCRYAERIATVADLARMFGKVAAAEMRRTR